MPLMDSQQWKPVGIQDLESAAWKVLRSRVNMLVTAGPGAGKTELLAQRAVYLLQTGICPFPKRILAISFKRDAAKNIASRVALRCGKEAKRFESHTLDSFAKSLVDRFHAGLPPEWRPPADYQILQYFAGREAEAWIRAQRFPPGISAPPQYWTRDQHKQYLEQSTVGVPLPFDSQRMDPAGYWIAQTWWKEALGQTGLTSRLTFPMISRLAGLLIRTNPLIRNALLNTYSFVFLDEFQDTMISQYDLISECFMKTDSVLTAVGDSKQRIMGWAGAMADSFDRFKADFLAQDEPLIRNYRSAMALVKVQQIIAEALESDPPKVQAVKGADVPGVCEIWEFQNEHMEAEMIASLIENGLHKKGLQPRDFCILVKQRCELMSATVIAALKARGIRARDETTLQDLLAEPVCELLISILRLIARGRDPVAWTELCHMVAFLHGWQGDEDTEMASREAGRIVRAAREACNKLDAATIQDDMHKLIEIVGKERLKAQWRQYTRGEFFQRQIEGFSAALKNSYLEFKSLTTAVEDLVGDNVVPAMTIHKSKGLEFHTIIFVGLEDSSWWSFASQSDEDKRAFFVAFSRAKERVFFTFSDVRDTGRGAAVQQRSSIDDLYAIMRRAGIYHRNCRQ